VFVHMSIHHPKPQYEAELIDSMHRVGKAIAGKPGLRAGHVMKDERSSLLIGLAIWDSKEHMLAQRPAMLDAVKDDDFDLWEERKPESFWLGDV
jgi:heme-degrading monooxygenase HmoA